MTDIATLAPSAAALKTTGETPNGSVYNVFMGSSNRLLGAVVGALGVGLVLYTTKPDLIMIKDAEGKVTREIDWKILAFWIVVGAIIGAIVLKS